MTVNAEFGSPRRDSCYPANRNVEGRFDWSLPLAQLAGEPVQALISWGPDTLVVSRTHLSLISPPPREHRTSTTQPGLTRWTHRKAHGSPVVVHDDSAHHLDPQGRLVARRSNGAPVHERPQELPGLGPSSDVSLLFPREGELAAVLQHVGQLHGDPPLARTLCVAPGSRLSSWGLESPGVLHPPALAFPERGRVYWRTDPSGEVVYGDLEQRRTGRAFRLPLDRLVEWSASPRGRVYVAGYVGERPTALAFTGLGEELWRWSDPQLLGDWSRACPPAVGDDDTALFFGASEVVALRRGDAQWWASIDGEGPLRGAILRDGSSLIARGSILRGFEPAGALRFQVDAKEPIVAGPTITASGWIQVASARRLIGVC